MNYTAYVIIMTVAACAVMFGFAFYISHKADGWHREYRELPVMHRFVYSIARFIVSCWWGVLLAAAAACGITLWRGRR